jgi:hypothetical protein
MIGQKPLMTRLAASVVGLCLAGACFGTGAATPSYSVVLDNASSQGSQNLNLSGYVTSSETGKMLTGVNIDLVPPTGAAIRLASNLPLAAGGKSPFAWSGSVPAGTSIVAGSQIRVSAVIETAVALLPVINGSSIVQLLASNAPAAPEGMKLACGNVNASPNSAAAEKCPVVLNNGISYWPFGYLDKRNAVSLIGFTADGQMVSRQDMSGLNNIFKIEFDEDKQTLTVWSQGNGKSVLSWLPGPSVVQIPVSKAPTPPSGMKLACMTGPYSPTPDGVATSCPVLIDNGVSFWPFAYIDNRVSVGWVGYNPAKEPVSSLELPGTRYAWKITVNPKDKTASLWGQSTPSRLSSISIAWNQVPVIVQTDVTKVPSVPTGLQLYCSTGPNSPTVPVSKTCPVVMYRGLAYWPFSYRDNRYSLALIAFTSAGKVYSQREVQGTRYAWNATIDRAKSTVVVSGQSGVEVSLPWSELK